MVLKSPSRPRELVRPYARSICAGGSVLTALALLAATGSQTLDVAAASSSTTTCAKYASPNGSDSWPGTESKPYASVQHLVDHLAAGQTGCLFGGSYPGNLRTGVAALTVRSLPGQRARLLGYIWLQPSANDFTLQDLDVDGHDVTPPTVQVNADRVRLHNLEITNRNKPGSSYNGMCVLAGPNFEGQPANTAYALTISGSRIHNCGDDGHEHAIYLESTRGAHIVDSFLYDNPGFGLLFYPDAQGSLVEYDLIDGNSGECRANLSFSGEAAGGEYDQPHGSSKNVVQYSLVTNSLCRYNVDSFYPLGSLAPAGNSVHDSCVWNAPFGNFGPERTDGGALAYSQYDNLDSDPLYVDRAGGDFRLQPGSPCSGRGPRAPSPGCVVPPMVGLRVTLARKRIRRSGCSSGRVRYVRSRRVGRVLRQTPRRGSRIGFGSRIQLVVGRR
jgi:hypothetical protein